MIERLVFGSVALVDVDQTARLLDAYHAAGGRALDLANVYTNGAAQAAVAAWLRGGSPSRRDELTIYAKGCHPPVCAPEHVPAEVETARLRIGVDVLDVFLLHRDDPAVPVARWVEALVAQVDAGTIRRFGVSNWTLARALELRDHLGPSGADALAVSSNQFSLAEMLAPPWPGCLAADAAEIASLGAAGIELLAWSSVAIGFFAGRDSPSFDSDGNRARRRRAAELGAELDASPTQVALAYVLHQPPHVRAVFGTRSERHLAEALAATRVELTEDQLRRLEHGDVRRS